MGGRGEGAAGVSNAGYIRMHREIWNSPEFRDSEFSEREAFLWMVSEAAWRDRVMPTSNGPLPLKRGQFSASFRFMADRFGWSKDRVFRFLKRLENRDTIATATATDRATGQKIITIRNYDAYQSDADAEDTCGETAGPENRDKSETNYKKLKKINTPQTPRAGGPSESDFSGGKSDTESEMLDRVADFWAAQIEKGGFVAASSFNAGVARRMVDRKLVTPERLREIGILL